MLVAARTQSPGSNQCWSRNAGKLVRETPFWSKPAPIGLGMGHFERFLAAEGYPRPASPQGGASGRSQKVGLGFLPLHLRRRAPSGRQGGGSRPALPALHDVLCRSRSSGSFGLRVAVVEPSAKTLGLRV